MEKVRKIVFNQKFIAYCCLIVALGATLGSLFFSELMHFPPCVLCWYQRICMYPLVIILSVGILRKNKELPLYVLPLSIIGLVISIFHNLLYYEILPEAAAPCTAGVSCTTKFIEYFGFVTIPFLSMVSFILITIGMIVFWKLNKKQK